MSPTISPTLKGDYVCNSRRSTGLHGYRGARLLETMAGRFLDRHASAADVERWRTNGSVDRGLWNKAGEAGLLGISIPEEYGGGGGDFRHEIVLMEQLGLRGVQGFALPLHNAVVAPYLVSYGLEAQKRKWLPKVVTGETGAGGRDVRARGRIGPAGHAHDGPARRRSLRDQRPEDVHYQRVACDAGDRRREDRPGRRREGHLPVRGGSRQGRGIRPWAPAAQAGTGRARHHRAVLPRHAGSGGKPAGRRRRPGLSATDGKAAAGAHGDCVAEYGLHRASA